MGSALWRYRADVRGAASSAPASWAKSSAPTCQSCAFQPAAGSLLYRVIEKGRHPGGAWSLPRRSAALLCPASPLRWHITIAVRPTCQPTCCKRNAIILARIRSSVWMRRRFPSSLVLRFPKAAALRQLFQWIEGGFPCKLKTHARRTRLSWYR